MDPIFIVPSHNLESRSKYLKEDTSQFQKSTNYQGHPKCEMKLEICAISMTNSNVAQTPTLYEMWDFIDNVMSPHELVPSKSILTYEEVFDTYSKLVDIDKMFRELTQILILKKSIREQKR